MTCGDGVSEPGDFCLEIAVGPWGGTFEGGIRIADFNEDGALDVVHATGYMPGRAALWMGDGGGGFAKSSEVELTGALLDAAVGDLNADEHVDVVVTDYDGTHVLTGDGMGSFDAMNLLDIEFPSTAVAIADLNADGNPDILLGGDGQLGVALDVDGTFTLTQVVESVPCTSTRVTASTIDDDLLPDALLAAICADITIGRFVGVHLGAGAGVLSDGIDLDIGGDPFQAVATDVDGDGASDVLAVSAVRNELVVAYGDARGAFAEFDRWCTIEAPVALAVIDLDMDGYSDVVISSQAPSGATVGVHAGSADRGLPLAQVWDAGPRPGWVASDDVNSDATPDVLTVAGPILLSGA